MSLFYVEVPNRVKNYMRAWNIEGKEKGFSSIRTYNRTISYKEISTLMMESWHEINCLPNINELCDSQMNAYILEWSFYISQLALMKHMRSDARERHILANMHLRNFGFSTSDDNAKLMPLLFYTPAPSFVRSRLYRQDKEIFTKSSPLLHGDKSTYLDHHEILFAKIETLIGNCIRKYINPQINQIAISIETAIREEINFSLLTNKFHFKLILSIYILMSYLKYNFQGKSNHQILDFKLQDIGLNATTIHSLLNRHWIWTFANDGGEFSLFNRGIISIPELDDAFFFSISRVWGLWVMSSYDSAEYNQKFPIIKSRIQGINNIGHSIGGKINLYLKNNPRDRELIYPYAKKLSFHPDVDIDNLPVISQKSIVNEAYKKYKK